MGRARGRTMALTWNQVLQAKNNEPGKPRYIGDGDGLWLRLGPNGAKSWVFRYRAEAKQREMGLGSIKTFNLAEARQRATKLRQDLFDYRAGEALHPVEAKRAKQRSAEREAEITRT